MTSHEHNGIMYPEYKPLELNAAKAEIDGYCYFIDKFFADVYPSREPADFHVDGDSLAEIAVRVDQRKLHYKMYHSENGKQTDINELKETALIGYWFIKYKPILHKKRGVFSASDINECFAVFLIRHAIREYRKALNLEPYRIDLKKWKEVKYTLKNRIYSYDSLVLLVETLAHYNEPPASVSEHKIGA